MKRVGSVLLAGAIALGLSACTFGTETISGDPGIPGLEDGVLTVGMECQYAPYNWTQYDDADGALPIANHPGAYANGYDVMVAEALCDANGWNLEILELDWSGLTPALESGIIDAAIAGQSMTAERMEEVEMVGPYYCADIVCMARAGTGQAEAASVFELSGSCTSQIGTVWYDICLPQIPGAEIREPAGTAGDMILALESGTVDFICTDLPTAKGAAAKNDRLVILDFSGTEGDFQFETEEIRAEAVHIGISVRKGNIPLKNALDTALSAISRAELDAWMERAVSIRPAA